MLVRQISDMVRSEMIGDDDEEERNDTDYPKINLPAEYTSYIWEADPDLVETRHLISESFRQQWEKGIQAYIKGDWQKARDIFHETVRLPGGVEDGPSKFLINVIDRHGGTKPTDWAGYRMDDDGEH